nr:Ycf12 [Pseudoerythrocladia kornmannii]
MFNLLNSINWQVIAQLVSLGVIVLLGPIVIVLLSLKKGNL